MEARDISLLMEEARDILMEATDILVVEAKETYSWKQLRLNSCEQMRR